MIRLTSLAISILLAVAATATAAPPEANPRLGINLAGPADWMTELPFVDVFAVFSSIGQYSNHGAWGLAEYYNSQPADYPKLAATLEAAKQWGQPVETGK